MVNDNKIPTKNLTNLKSPMFNTNKGTGDQKNINIKDIDKWKKQLVTPKPLSLDAKKGKAELEKAGKNSRVTLDFIQANKQNANAKQNANKCSSFCREEGFHILPLRYSIKQGKAPVLPTNLGENVKSVNLQHSSYTVEMIDSGYIYQLVVRTSGKKEWWAYKVTPSGYLSLFPIGKPAPGTVPEFACKSANHNFAGSLITVPHNPKDIEKTTYILYTHVALTQNKIKEFENNPEGLFKNNNWQKIDVAGWKGGNHSQKHCLNNKNLKSSIDNIISFGGRINQAVDKFNAQPKFFASIALYDPIGITVKLNDYRNEAYALVDAFLDAKDKRGVSNQRKLDAVQRVDSIEGALEKRVTKTIEYHNQLDRDTAPYIEAKFKNRLNIVDQQIQDARRSNDSKRVQELEVSKKIILEDYNRTAKARAGEGSKVAEAWLKADFQVCFENLNYQEVDAFKKQVSSQYTSALNLSNQRAQDHLNWIKSENLLSALDIYDDKDLQNGCAFKAHVANMLFGMEGAIQAAEQIDNWIKKPEFERKNLFIRGLYSNQLEAKAKHDEVKNTAADFTAAGIKVTKLLVDYLKKTDSAWDEWARNQDIDLKNPDKNKNTWNGSFKRPEKVVMLYVSNFARIIFRAGMGTSAESRFVRAISQKLLFAQMGELAEKLRFDQVVHAVDPESQKVGKSNLNTGLANRAVAQLAPKTKEATIRSLDILIDDAMTKKQQVALKLEEIEKIGGKGMAANHTNNYHQVRASGILVLLEAINLAHMLNSGKYQDKAQIAALIASVSALMAFGLDIFYGLAKGARETASAAGYAGAGAAATRGAANIQRAGIKWAAGSLSALAGGITACLDFAKFLSLEGKVGIPNGLRALYFTRGVSGILATGLGLLAALTYIEPLMNYLNRVGGSPVIQRIGAKVFGDTTLKYSVKKVTREIVRNALLRGISWVSGVGLILTIIEVGLLIYMESTKLRRWCEHSTFRKDKTNKIMPEKQEVEDFEALFA